MDSLEITLIVAVIAVLVVFAALFSILLLDIYSKEKLLIQRGIWDEKLEREEVRKAKTSYKVLAITGKVVSWAILLLIISGFALATYNRYVNENFVPQGQTMPVVVASGSMSSLNDSDRSLENLKTFNKVNDPIESSLLDDIASTEQDIDNLDKLDPNYETDRVTLEIVLNGFNEDLIALRGERAKLQNVIDIIKNTHFRQFDILTFHSTPLEEDLKVLDTYMYRDLNGNFILHRLRRIEPVIKDGLIEYYNYIFKGDANPGEDRFAVRYDQIGGVYKNEKVEFFGAFILFMQSPLGLIVTVGCVIVVVINDSIDAKIRKHEKERLALLNKRRQYLATLDPNTGQFANPDVINTTIEEKPEGDAS